jgi:hypothetical protein
MDSPPPVLPRSLGNRRLLATGVGSSEAAARYLVSLLNEGGMTAEFRPLSFFYAPTVEGVEPGTTLALFSQGLAPNSGIALAHRHRFAQTLLFTAATPEGQRAGGKEGRAALLETLMSEGATIIRHPMEDEYEILPRVVGPVCAMAAAYRTAQVLVPGRFADEGGPGLADVLPLFEDPFPRRGAESQPPGMDPWVDDLLSGVNFLFTNTSSLYGQNLSCKVLETLFQPPPTLSDALTYSHGPFQLDCVHPRPKWLLTSSSPEEVELTRRLTPLLERAGPLRVFRAALPAPLAIFHYEAFLNQLVLSVLERHPVDLIDWPGKGADQEGYEIDQPPPRL